MSKRKKKAKKPAKKRAKKKEEHEPMWILQVCSLHSDRHTLMEDGICKINRNVFHISLNEFPHIMSSLERLRRRQLVTMLQAKIAAAACVGCLVIPLDDRDFDAPSDLDL